MDTATRPATPTDLPMPVQTGKEAEWAEILFRMNYQTPGGVLCTWLGCLTVIAKYSGRSVCRFHASRG